MSQGVINRVPALPAGPITGVPLRSDIWTQSSHALRILFQYWDYGKIGAAELCKSLRGLGFHVNREFHDFLEQRMRARDASYAVFLRHLKDSHAGFTALPNEELQHEYVETPMNDANSSYTGFSRDACSSFQIARQRKDDQFRNAPISPSSKAPFDTDRVSINAMRDIVSGATAQEVESTASRVLSISDSSTGSNRLASRSPSGVVSPVSGRRKPSRIFSSQLSGALTVMDDLPVPVPRHGPGRQLGRASSPRSSLTGHLEPSFDFRGVDRMLDSAIGRSNTNGEPVFQEVEGVPPSRRMRKLKPSLNEPSTNINVITWSGPPPGKKPTGVSRRCSPTRPATAGAGAAPALASLDSRVGLGDNLPATSPKRETEFTRRHLTETSNSAGGSPSLAHRRPQTTSAPSSNPASPNSMRAKLRPNPSAGSARPKTPFATDVDDLDSLRAVYHNMRCGKGIPAKPFSQAQ